MLYDGNLLFIMPVSFRIPNTFFFVNSGPLNDEVILETFVQNQEPAVNNLNDDSFEHLTQAASGATTGDWFVML